MKKSLLYKCLAAAGVFVITAGAAGCGTDREAQEAYRQLGIRQIQEGDYAAAADTLQKALDESRGKIGAEETDICYYKALAQYKDGDTAGAIETYDSLLEYDDKNAEAYFLRGSAFLQEGEGKKCISDYNNAVKYAEDDYQMYIEIYENLAGAGYEENGEKYLDQALEQKASDGEDYCMQGYIYYLKEDYEQAASLIEKAVKEGYDKAWIYQSRLLRAQGDTEGADEAFDKYLNEHPDDAEALNEAGTIELNAGNYDSALKAFQQAAKADPKGENQQLQRNLIYAYEYTGDFDTAYDLMQDYLDRYSNDEEAQREYEFLKTRVHTGDTGSSESGTDGEQTGSSESGDNGDQTGSSSGDNGQ